MTTYAHDDLTRILDMHGKWWRSKEGGVRAVLSGADLRRADLSGAVLSDETLLSDGVRWGEYKRDLVPALCTAGGKTLAEVATEEHWTCHSWEKQNGVRTLGCPMVVAFNAKTLAEVPALHRWQAGRFIELFDSGLIPRPEVSA